jgi:hypothetical protein
MKGRHSQGRGDRESERNLDKGRGIRVEREGEEGADEEVGRRQEKKARHKDKKEVEVEPEGGSEVIKKKP